MVVKYRFIKLNGYKPELRRDPNLATLWQMALARPR
jgi:hypothetical protein